MKRIILFIILCIISINQTNASLINENGGKFCVLYEKDYEKYPKETKEFINKLSYVDTKHYKGIIGGENIKILGYKSKDLKLIDCYVSRNSKHSSYVLFVNDKMGYKYIVIKDGNIIVDIFNNNTTSIKYDYDNSLGLNIDAYISSNGKHIFYIVKPNLDEPENDFYELYKGKFGLYIDNIRIGYFNDINPKYQKKEGERGYRWKKFFEVENLGKKVFVSYKFTGEDRFGDKYDLAEKTMDKIDDFVFELNPNKYERYLKILEKELDKIEKIGDEDISFQEYKKQILIYYIFSEIKIREIKYNSKEFRL